jgi:primosomal protein N' (replication factor Y)
MAMDRVRVANVALDPRAGGSDAVYTYRADASAHVGDARFVNVGNRPVMGYVTSIFDANEADLGFGFESLRDLGEEVTNLSLPSQSIQLAQFVAAEYLCSLSVALSAATPPGVQDRLVSGWTLAAEPQSEFSLSAEPGEKLTAAQQEAMRTLQDAGGTLAETASKRIPAAQAKVLSQLVAKGLVKRTVQVQPFQERRASREYLALSPDHDAIEKFLATQGVRKPAQALTLMRLQGAENSFFSIAEIKALAGVTETTVKALVDVGLLHSVDPEEKRVPKLPEPNRYQQLAIDAVSRAIRARESHGFLLFGVTGSGKTEVYLRLAQEALQRGRQVLYIVPEIALATQAISQLRERFGKGVTILHSELSPSDRLQNWMRVREGEAPVVLGARSALFAPLDNVGLIILDEEHEASYKQESSPRYYAKRVAQELSSMHGCPLVLGSATPSIESFYEAEQEKLTLLSLPERAASAQLPTVHIDDLSIGYRSNRPSILAEALHTRLGEILDRKEQAILFLNRRAYAPFVICRDCGTQMLCPRCSVSLSYHRRDGMLRCHHCDYRTPSPDVCPKCQGTRMNPFGIGTEKVEEAVTQLFPDARIARLDRDIARKKGALESILAAFRSGDTDVLVGTQMVAKGLDFPNVTLVGVVAADLSLNIPDFRSSERTFQLLSQVAGRAGRGSKLGDVVIQTFNPSHIAVTTAQSHDYPAFYEELKLEREQALYPPFVRLVNVVLSGESLTEVSDASHEAAVRIRQGLSKESQILGPANCPLERLHNRWRRHILVKLSGEDPPAKVGEALLGWTVKGVQSIVDVDPYSLM